MQVVVTEFLSLDGVMEEPRWTFNFERGRDGDRFKYEELFDAESLLLGRVTYQGFAAAWPGMGGDDFGRRMNSIHKYAVSRTLADADATWGPTTVLRGDPAEEVASLRRREGGTLLVEGSAQLVGTLASHDLVDEYRLMVFPIILGGGKRLFPDTARSPVKLRLTSEAVTGDGVVLLRYLRPAG